MSSLPDLGAFRGLGDQVLLMSNQVRWEECPPQVPRSVRLQHGWLHQLGVRRRSRRSTAPATHQLPWYPPIGCNMNGKIWQIINTFTTFDFYSYCSRLSCIVQSNVSTPCHFFVYPMFLLKMICAALCLLRTFTSVIGCTTFYPSASPDCSWANCIGTLCWASSI